MLYAIFSAPKPDARPDEYVFAGMLALICSSPSHLSIEPGWIIILPPFQRTHVLTHAAGLVIHYAMDLPSQGGLGLRRCQWTTTTLNLASQNAAKRLGFQYEGVLRAMWVLPPGKEGVRRASGVFTLFFYPSCPSCPHSTPPYLSLLIIINPR